MALIALLGAALVALRPEEAVAPAPTPPPVAVVGEAPPPASAPCCRLPANTPVAIELLDAVSTKTHKRGDHFAIRLCEPVVVDGRMLIPVGAIGQGEVVDAAAGGFAGHPGKLILAARYIDYGGVRTLLHAFKPGGQGGRDNGSLATYLSATPYVGILALGIQGGNVDFPKGARAIAKTSVDSLLPPLSTPPPSAPNLPIGQP